jgi:hypothetical protein
MSRAAFQQNEIKFGETRNRKSPILADRAPRAVSPSFPAIRRYLLQHAEFDASVGCTTLGRWSVATRHSLGGSNYDLADVNMDGEVNSSDRVVARDNHVRFPDAFTIRTFASSFIEQIGGFDVHQYFGNMGM